MSPPTPITEPSSDSAMPQADARYLLTPEDLEEHKRQAKRWGWILCPLLFLACWLGLAYQARLKLEPKLSRNLAALMAEDENLKRYDISVQLPNGETELVRAAEGERRGHLIANFHWNGQKGRITGAVRDEKDRLEVRDWVPGAFLESQRGLAGKLYGATGLTSEVGLEPSGTLEITWDPVVRKAKGVFGSNAEEQEVLTILQNAKGFQTLAPPEFSSGETEIARSPVNWDRYEKLFQIALNAGPVGAIRANRHSIRVQVIMDSERLKDEFEKDLKNVVKPLKVLEVSVFQGNLPPNSAVHRDRSVARSDPGCRLHLHSPWWGCIGSPPERIGNPDQGNRGRKGETGRSKNRLSQRDRNRHRGRREKPRPLALVHDRR